MALTSTQLTAAKIMLPNRVNSDVATSATGSIYGFDLPTSATGGVWLESLVNGAINNSATLTLYDSTGATIIATGTGGVHSSSAIAGRYYVHVVCVDVAVTLAIYDNATSNNAITYQSLLVSTPAPATVAPVIPPVVTLTPEQLAQIAADKIALADMKAAIKTGTALSNDDVVFYTLGDSVLAAAVMLSLDHGGGYAELSVLGLTDTKIILVMSIYNVKAEASRYESELGIDAMNANKALISSYIAYAATNSITLPSFAGLFNAFRSDKVVFESVRQWNKTRAV